MTSHVDTQIIARRPFFECVFSYGSLTLTSPTRFPNRQIACGAARSERGLDPVRIDTYVIGHTINLHVTVHQADR